MQTGREERTTDVDMLARGSVLVLAGRPGTMAGGDVGLGRGGRVGDVCSRVGALVGVKGMCCWRYCGVMASVSASVVR
jgi:hypothetical protein